MEQASMELLNRAAQGLFEIATPDGRCPPLHDSAAVDITGMYNDFSRQVAPDDFKQAPWTSGKSAFLPWGGYAIFRGTDRYALFDAGPYGAGHQHDDTMQFIAFAHGRWFCIDAGKPRYDRSEMNWHLKSSLSHNVVLIDGRPHEEKDPVKILKSPHPMAFVERGGVTAAAAARNLLPIARSEQDRPAAF